VARDDFGGEFGRVDGVLAGSLQLSAVS
jgi:hypothetical protein